jgi:hypothetical protein
VLVAVGAPREELALACAFDEGSALQSRGRASLL